MNDYKEDVETNEVVELNKEDLEIRGKVKKDIEQGLERANVISKQMRSQARREVKPKTDFLNVIDEARKELEEGVAFLEVAEESPKLILTDSDKYIKSTKGIVYAIMNHWRKPNEEIKGYEFQAYLAHVANRYLQEWLKIQSIKESFNIEERNPRQFPSTFAVYHEETELVQFNILEKEYGVRKRPETEDVVLEKHEERLVVLDKDIELQKEKVAKAIERRDYPLKHYKGLKNYISWVFLNKKKMYDSFNKLLKREESHLIYLKEEKERAIQYLPIILEENGKKRALIEKVEPFFEELGYTFITDDHRLY